MTQVRGGLTVGAALALGLASTGAFAQGSYQSQPIGGRSAIMGGTGVAIGMDGSTPLINPAGALNVRRGSLVISTRVLEFKSRSLPGWRKPGPVDPSVHGEFELDDGDVSDTSFNLIPSGTCYFEDFGTADDTFHDPTGKKRPPASPGRNQIAICIHTTEANKTSIVAERVNAVSDVARIEASNSIDTFWQRLNLGAAWGIDLTDELALGAGISVVGTSYRAIILGTAMVADFASDRTSLAGFQRAVTASSWDLVPTVGVSYRASDALTIGTSFRFPSIHMTGSFNSSLLVERHQGQAWHFTADGEMTAALPARAGLGLGLELDRVRAEVDGFFYFPEGDFVTTDREQTETFVQPDGSSTTAVEEFSLSDPAGAVTNIAAGLEVFVTDRFSLLGGFSTDFSAFDAFTSNDVKTRMIGRWMDAYHMSAGVGSYGPRGELLIGTRFTYGTGEERAVNQFATVPDVTAVDTSMFAVMLTLAGRVNLSAIGEMVLGEEEEDGAAEGGEPKDREDDQAEGDEPEDPKEE